jgi:hypothetical protein
MGDGPGRAERHAMAAKDAIFFIGVSNDFSFMIGETPGTTDGADAAAGTFFFVNPYPAHIFLQSIVFVDYQADPYGLQP